MSAKFLRSREHSTFWLTAYRHPVLKISAGISFEPRVLPEDKSRIVLLVFVRAWGFARRQMFSRFACFRDGWKFIKPNIGFYLWQSVDSIVIDS